MHSHPHIPIQFLQASRVQNIIRNLCISYKRTFLNRFLLNLLPWIKTNTSPSCEWLLSTCDSTPAAMETQMPQGTQSVRARRDSGHPLVQTAPPTAWMKKLRAREKNRFYCHVSDKVTQLGNGRMRTRPGHIRTVWDLLSILHTPDTIGGTGNAAVTTTGLKTG